MIEPIEREDDDDPVGDEILRHLAEEWIDNPALGELLPVNVVPGED